MSRKRILIELLVHVKLDAILRFLSCILVRILYVKYGTISVDLNELNICDICRNHTH